MSGHHPIENLRKAMSAESRKRAELKADALRQEMALAELRKALSLTQTELAEELHIKQAALARLENRTDMYISSLRKYIAALGGELDIVARFPNAEVHIQNLHDLR